MNHELHTEITIDAPIAVVWENLTDLASWADWNPFIISAAGRVAVDERLTNRIQPPGGRAMTFKPTVTVVEEARVFEWLGSLGVPGVLDGRHRFELGATAAGGTRLVHTESFSGLLVRVMRKSLDSQTRVGFVAMNEALRDRAERTNATPC